MLSIRQPAQRPYNEAHTAHSELTNASSSFETSKGHAADLIEKGTLYRAAKAKFEASSAELDVGRCKLTLA